MSCKRFIISGRVQGVWFRGSTREEALRLGLHGHAINLPDGRVEVLACGDAVALDHLRSWLWHGPELAAVSNVCSEDLPEIAITGFETG